MRDYLYGKRVLIISPTDTEMTQNLPKFKFVELEDVSQFEHGLWGKFMR